MGRPQQPELARSAKTDLDPDHVETGLQGLKKPAAGGETGPVPAENQPGHHPPTDQDKPDLDAFAARLGTDPKDPTATRARKAPRKATPAKSAPTKAKAASRPAATTKKSPAAPPRTEVTPAKGPAAALAPTPEEAAHFSAPQPEPTEQHREPRLLGIVLMPLRETVKRLEQLDRTLTERLDRKRPRGGRAPRGR